MLSKFLVAATALLSITSAQIIDNALNSGLKGDYVDPASVPELDFTIDYDVVGKPHSGVLEIYTGEEITLNYTFTNNEPEEVHIVGVGGNFADPKNGQLLANITDAKVGPLTLQPGETGSFNQRIGVSVPIGNYLLTPGLYLVKGSNLAMLGAKTILTMVDEEPLSWFAPHMLMLELMLIGTLAAGVYVIYINYGADYLKTAGVTGTAVPPSAAGSARVTRSTGASVDESWLPDHIKKTNKKKNK